jgi:hypothetical protein
MEEEFPRSHMATSVALAPPVIAFVVVGRGHHGERGNNGRGCRGGRGLPSKCSAFGSMDHILSSFTVYDAALMKLSIAKRKIIIQKYGSHGSIEASHTTLLSDVSQDDSLLHSDDAVPTVKDGRV